MTPGTLITFFRFLQFRDTLFNFNVQQCRISGAHTYVGILGGVTLGLWVPPASLLACDDALKVASFGTTFRPCLKPVGRPLLV